MTEKDKTTQDSNLTTNSLDQTIQHLNNPVLELPIIEKSYLKEIKNHVQEDNIFYFSDEISKVAISVISDEIMRVRMAPKGVFLEDFSYAIQSNNPRTSIFTFEEDEGNFKIKTNTTTCVINKNDFLISFENRLGLQTVTDHSPMHWEENDEFGGFYVYCSKKAQKNDAYFGLGDKAMDLNLRGKRVYNWNTDAYSYHFGQDPLYRTIPFYIGKNENGDCYGIFFDNSFKTHFDFAAESEDMTSFWADGGELNYYYIHGPNFIDVVKRYHELTGTHYLPPMWALGFHQCRWSYFPEEKVKDLAYQFRSRKIPCDALYLDIDYMDGYRCFTWDRKRFPNPKRMIKELSKDGFRTVVIIDPGIKVDPNYWVYKEGKENNFFCRRGDDYFMEGYVWPGLCRFPDFTNPKVRTWWGGLFQELVNEGIAGVWNDMNEPAVFGKGTFPNDVRHHYDGQGGSHRKAHNIYGMQMVRATYEGLEKLLKNKRPFTITRAAYSGTQRFSSVWTGDNVATWEHLKIGVIQLQRLSISGMSFCGTDIGGFSGEPDGELFTRWMQFGVFSPFMRAHSAGDTGEREPWSFGTDYEAINKKFIELRYKLLPYIYSTFWEQTKFGFPILRPMSMLEQEVLENSSRTDTFCFGSKILVKPITEPGLAETEMYLPHKKMLWYDYWTNQKYEGGNTYQIETPIESMPIFIKAGTVLPEYPVFQHVDEIELKSLKLKMYFAPYPCTSYTFEDNRDTFAYQQDIYLEKKFETNGTASKFELVQSMKGLYNERYKIYEVELVGLPFKPQFVKVDGEMVEFSIDENNQISCKIPKDFLTLEIE